MASAKYPQVAVTSERPAMNGQVVKGMAGSTIVMEDDPDNAYITGNGWYGVWPISETNLEDIIRVAAVMEERKAARELLQKDRGAAIEAAPARSYMLTSTGDLKDLASEAAWQWVGSYLKERE